jgi:ATP-dependent helicase/nuclease subunit A
MATMSDGVHVTPRLPADATPALPRQLILASAGSGKTFRISSQLIAILAAGEQPDAIFASTFTRKAAGEILDRVLGRLAEASLSREAAAELAGHARDCGAPNAQPDPAFWLDVLERVVPQLHRLNIGTLDAFFVRAVRSFAFELGLPPEWSIADDAGNATIQERALLDVFREVDPALLVQLVQDIAGGRATRSVHDALLQRAGALLKLHYALHPDARDVGWSALDDDRAEEPAPSVQRVAQRAAQRAALAAAIAQADDLPRTAKGAPNRTWQNAVAAAARAVEVADWDALLNGKLCSAVLNGDDFAGHPVPPAVAALLHEAWTLARADVQARFAVQARALGGFSRLYAAALERRRRDSGLFGFDDLTRALGGEDGIAARPDLYYRLDARTRHILLDEFQDTSLAQYEAIEPLLAELVSGYEGERAALIVADPKQSIYGWRGGSPDIVTAVQQRHQLDVARLFRSWRSSPVVLDTVNELFAALPGLPIWADDDVAGAVVREWLAAFTPHESAKPALPGYARVEAGAFDEGTGQDRPKLCRYAAERVAELHARMPDCSIGVLTRRNATVARMMLELKRCGVRASEEGGNPLTDSAAVTSILALLRLADHPGNTVARYHVAHTPVGTALGYTDHADDDAARRLAERVRRHLVRDGYGVTVADLVARIRDDCDTRELRRTSQLVELAWRYEPEATLRPSDFVRWIEARRVEDPVAAQVRVMTVHQSKGLEFDIVVLPELDAPLVHGSVTAPLAYRSHPAERPTLAFPYVAARFMPLFSDTPKLAAAADQARSAELRDSLSSLYVALTRARYALHVFIRPDGPNGPSTAKTGARVLREALAADAHDIREGAVLHERGNPEWCQLLEDVPRKAPDAPAHGPVAIKLADGAGRHRTLPRRTPSELEGGSRTDLSLVLRLGAAEARDRGSIAHLWLEQVQWLEEGVPHHDTRAQLARTVAPDIDDASLAGITARFDAWLASPAIAAALSRSAHPAAADRTDVVSRVECEVPFIHRDGDILIEGIIDRLVIDRSEDGVSAARIIDYKTDDVSDDAALARRFDHYVPQLQAYRRAVAGMYRLPPHAVSAHLVFLEAGAVLEVPHERTAPAAPQT